MKSRGNQARMIKTKQNIGGPCLFFHGKTNFLLVVPQPLQLTLLLESCMIWNLIETENFKNICCWIWQEVWGLCINQANIRSRKWNKSNWVYNYYLESQRPVQSHGNSRALIYSESNWRIEVPLFFSWHANVALDMEGYVFINNRVFTEGLNARQGTLAAAHILLESSFQTKRFTLC
jgi:hypothetical protein